MKPAVVSRQMAHSVCTPGEHPKGLWHRETTPALCPNKSRHLAQSSHPAAGKKQPPPPQKPRGEKALEQTVTRGEQFCSVLFARPDRTSFVWHFVKHWAVLTQRSSVVHSRIRPFYFTTVKEST